ncbi:hypothetical protein [Blastopirellula retiformator]|uniref:Uncharacterized protein n=1 Tax=Blastopirellula retiformator TaxID=2527970 RepID=A0A5C5VJT8_9BACT|nr:hypothetical protein [Blastopirellula retiformator]TWT38878.1 hypothetical protein Enr8_05720 [Blastopirellula retiformator]
MTVEKDGFTRFAPAAKGRDRYLTMDKSQAIRVIEAQRCLASQPQLRSSQFDAGYGVMLSAAR